MEEVAAALTSVVFAHPGGPYSSTPRGRHRPRRTKASGCAIGHSMLFDVETMRENKPPVIRFFLQIHKCAFLSKATQLATCLSLSLTSSRPPICSQVTGESSVLPMLLLRQEGRTDFKASWKCFILTSCSPEHCRRCDRNSNRFLQLLSTQSPYYFLCNLSHI